MLPTSVGKPSLPLSPTLKVCFSESPPKGCDEPPELLKPSKKVGLVIVGGATRLSVFTETSIELEFE